jgi:hypothetical protein
MLAWCSGKTGRSGVRLTVFRPMEMAATRILLRHILCGVSQIAIQPNIDSPDQKRTSVACDHMDNRFGRRFTDAESGEDRSGPDYASVRRTLPAES